MQRWWRRVKMVVAALKGKDFWFVKDDAGARIKRNGQSGAEVLVQWVPDKKVPGTRRDYVLLRLTAALPNATCRRCLGEVNRAGAVIVSRQG